MPRTYLAVLLQAAGACFPLREPPNPPRKRRNDSPHAQAGGSGPVSLVDVARSRRDQSRPGMPLEPTPGIAPPRVLRPCVQRALTQRVALHAGANRHLCEVRARSPFLGRQALHPRQSTGRRRCHFGTLMGATGGTQTHSRRTGRKLGRLRYARQGLVRVPESNTKYGGRGGITGDNAAPVMGPSIGESSGNPKRKNCA